MEIKAKIIEPEFKPIELTLTIKSINELKTLWHRFNRHLSATGEYKYETYVQYPIKDVANTFSVWKKLDDLLKGV